MASVASRESYFEAGLDVLSDLGYGGLKLAEVCNRLGVTTGSFYHYFSSWRAHTSELVAHWLQGRTIQVVEAVRAEPDPRRRIDTLIQVGPTRDTGALEWIAGQLLYALDSGRFATVPDGE
jgi:AcrR family transcriptional regulator